MPIADQRRAGFEAEGAHVERQPHGVINQIGHGSLAQAERVELLRVADGVALIRKVPGNVQVVSHDRESAGAVGCDAGGDRGGAGAHARDHACSGRGHGCGAAGPGCGPGEIARLCGRTVLQEQELELSAQAEKDRVRRPDAIARSGGDDVHRTGRGEAAERGSDHRVSRREAVHDAGRDGGNSRRR